MTGSGAPCGRTAARTATRGRYFSHDQARSRAYRWGEDGIAGICDDEQRLCLAVAMWNGRDPIIKERFFGVTNSEGNHGEDVKEQYFYLDGTPTHSYMRMLYKYPQREYPYLDLVDRQSVPRARRVRYELLDTDAFADGRYFDVVVEHAKATPEDLLLRVTVHNRGPDAADPAPVADAVVPQHLVVGGLAAQAGLAEVPDVAGRSVVEATHESLGRRWLVCQRRASAAVHRERDELRTVVRQPQPVAVRQGRHRPLIVHGETGAVNPSRTGTKAAVAVALDVPRRRIGDRPPAAHRRRGQAGRPDGRRRRRVRRHVRAARAEADEIYERRRRG